MKENSRKEKKGISFLKFCIVGTTAYFIDVGLFALLYNTIIPIDGIAHTISTCLSLVYTFFLNRSWTFGNGHYNCRLIIRRYIIKTIMYIAVSYVFLFLLQVVTKLEADICKFFVPAIMSVINYTADKCWVFKNKN